MYDVITIGSATIDVFSDSLSEIVKIITPKYEQDRIAYPSGSKTIIENLRFELGGGGSNTATSFSRLGLKTGFLGCIGNDSNADLVLKRLKEENIDFLGFRDKNNLTGYSIILDSIEHDRAILSFKGANDFLKYAKLKNHNLDTKWIYATSMLGTSFKTLYKIFKDAKEAGIKIAFNPSEYVFYKEPKVFDLIKMCNVLIINEREAFIATAKKCIVDQLKALSKLGPEMVVVTEGKEGAGLIHKKKITYINPLNVKVLETTGAGDAFGSGFIAGLILKKSPITALKLGTANAASVVKKKGAKNDLLTIKKAEQMLKKNYIIKKLKV